MNYSEMPLCDKRGKLFETPKQKIFGWKKKNKQTTTTTTAYLTVHIK